MCYQTKKMFAGHIKVLGGPYVARGPDVVLRQAGQGVDKVSLKLFSLAF